LIALSVEGGLLPTFNVVVNCWVCGLGESRLTLRGSLTVPVTLVESSVVELVV